MTPQEGLDAQRRPAVFLDRDGIINIDHGYVYRAEDLIFTPRVLEAIPLFNAAGSS